MKIFISSLVITVLLILAVVFIYLNITHTESTTLINPADLKLVYNVTGCAETDQGMATKSFGRDIVKAPLLEVKGNSVHYERSISHQCCRKADFKQAVHGNEIIIKEVWSGIGCKCQCFSDLEATVSNIPAGSYKVKVYQTGTEPGSDKHMEDEIIIHRRLKIK